MRVHLSQAIIPTVLIAAASGLFFAQRIDSAVAAPTPTKTLPATVVNVATVNVSTMVPLQWVPGSVSSRRDARVASTESGRVIANVDVGTRVRQGQVLARIDDEATGIAVQQAKANLQRAQSRSDFAKRQAARMESITTRSSFAEAQLDQIRADRDERLQETIQAQASLADAERRLRNAVVRAPFDGTVAERFVEVGEHLSEGAAVARLVDTEDLEINARAPVAMSATLRPGAKVQVRAGQSTLQAELRAIVPVGDTQSRQLEVRVALSASGWTVGDAVEVGLPSVAAHSAIAVPRDALVLRNDGTYVFRINAEGTAERLSVKTGAAQGELIEVSGDLADGDRLVTRGAERLEAGQSVQVAADS